MLEHFSHTLRATFISLRSRNFKLYFIGQLISNTGNWLTNVALTLLVLHLTQSGFDVGLLAACQYGPILFLSAWGGAIADHADKRRLLFVTQSLEMLQSVGLAALAFMPHTSIAGLYVLAFVGGLILAFDNPLRRSFVSEMVRREDIANAVVLNSTIVNTARIFGPTLAGVLIITVGYGWCFTFDALSYLAVLACLWLMRQRELYPAEHRPKQRGEIREGLRYVRSSPRLLTSFIMLAVIGTLTYNFNITLPLFVSDVLGRTNTTFTFLYSVFSLGAVMCALVVAQRGLVEMKHIILGAAGLGATMLLLALTSNVAVAAFCTLLLGVSSTLYMTSTTALTQLEASPAVRGRVLALQSVLLVGTTPVGGPVLGLLADAAGGRLPLILGGIVALFAAFYGHVAMRNMQHPKTQ